MDSLLYRALLVFHEAAYKLGALLMIGALALGARILRRRWVRPAGPI